MTKKQIQLLYNDLKLENETLKNFIKTMHGQQAIDRILMEIAIQRTNEILEEHHREYLYQKHCDNNIYDDT